MNDQQTQLEDTPVTEMGPMEAYCDEVTAELDADELEYHASSDEEKRVFRYVRHRLRIDDEMDRLKAQYESMVRDLKGKASALEYMHGAAVRVTVEKELGRRSTAKKPCRSWKTLFGTVGLRSVGGGLAIVNEDLLLAEAKKRRDLLACIKVEYTPLKSELTKFMESSGEVPPGCQLTDKEDKFYVSAPRNA